MAAIVLGLGATLLMDLWNLFLRSAFGVRSLDYGLLGRWLLHMARGTFRHASIAAAPRMPFERPAGWVAHYSIGVALAFGFVAIAPRGWLEHPTLAPALLYGIITVVFPYFVLQPALGFGIASSKAPKPWAARLKSLGTHAVFGIGLYVGALALAAASAPLLRAFAEVPANLHAISRKGVSCHASKGTPGRSTSLRATRCVPRPSRRASRPSTSS